MSTVHLNQFSLLPNDRSFLSFLLNKKIDRNYFLDYHYLLFLWPWLESFEIKRNVDWLTLVNSPCKWPRVGSAWASRTLLETLEGPGPIRSFSGTTMGLFKLKIKLSGMLIERSKNIQATQVGEAACTYFKSNSDGWLQKLQFNFWYDVFFHPQYPGPHHQHFSEFFGKYFMSMMKHQQLRWNIRTQHRFA